MDEKLRRCLLIFSVILALGCGAYAQQRHRVAVQVEDLSSLLQALRENVGLAGNIVVSLEAQVRNAYLSYVGAIKGQEVAQQNMDIAQESLRAARARVAVGVGAPIEVIQAQAVAASFEEQLIDATSLISTTEDNLRSLILDRDRPDYWDVRIEPTSTILLTERTVDLNDIIKTALANLFNVKFAREYGNTRARADLVVGGVTLLTDVPTTYFLFLEDQVAKIRANIVARFPVLDPSEEWHWDTARGIWVTEPRVTESTAKVPQTHVLYEATPQHPAQVRPWETDMKVGEWTTVKLSGQLPADQAQGMYDRCSKLLVAIKQARELANSIEVEEKDATAVIDYIFGE